MNGWLVKILATLITTALLGSFGFSWKLFSNVGISLSRIESRIDGIYRILLREED